MTDPETQRAIRNAYARGYSHAKVRRWPDGMPNPPEPVIRRLLAAVVAIRAKADRLRATFGPGDEVVQVFDGLIDEADAAGLAVDAWLEASVLPATPGGTVERFPEVVCPSCKADVRVNRTEVCPSCPRCGTILKAPPTAEPAKEPQ